jgi:hypothetical protein
MHVSSNPNPNHKYIQPFHLLQCCIQVLILNTGTHRVYTGYINVVNEIKKWTLHVASQEARKPGSQEARKPGSQEARRKPEIRDEGSFTGSSFIY